MDRRVVVTGLGVVAPNGVGIHAFTESLRSGISGISPSEERARLGFGCALAGVPQIEPGLPERTFHSAQLKAMNEVMLYAGLASLECWRSAGLMLDPVDDLEPRWRSGAIFGTGFGGLDTAGTKLVPLTDSAQIRRLGGAVPEQVMCSSVSAFLGGIFGFGGHLSTNSSACCTGTEAVILGMREIASGRADQMLVGSSECSSPYVSAGFDAMRVMARGWNDRPQEASRPLSASAAGFVPGAGAGALLLESLQSAKDRDAHIYAEVLGGAVNCGGQRNGGTTTAPNNAGAIRCIEMALNDAKAEPGSIDYINGHLTATMADSREIANLEVALRCHGKNLPLINSTKSLIGHALGAAGSIECVATVIQICEGFIHPSINCDDLHPEVRHVSDSIVREPIAVGIEVALKTSFGFGDVNACVVLRNYS